MPPATQLQCSSQNSTRCWCDEDIRAIIAIAHKVLRTLFFMPSQRKYCRDCAVNYEELTVRRNVPRWIKSLTRFRFTAQHCA
jgi:hypothetical protein